MDEAENQTPVRFSKRGGKIVMVTVKCSHCGTLRQVTRNYYLQEIVTGKSKNLCKGCAYQLPRLLARLKRAKQIEKLKTKKLRDQVFRAPCGSSIEQSPITLGADDPKRCESYYQCQDKHSHWYWKCLCHAAKCRWRGWQFHQP